MSAAINAIPILAYPIELIENIYRCATDPSNWKATLPALAQWVGAPRCLLLTPHNPPEEGGFYFNHMIPEQFLQLYVSKYQALDIWAQRATERGLTSEGTIVISDEDLVSFAELSHTEFYRDFLARHDTAHLLSGVVFGSDSPLGTFWVAIALHRGLADGPFTQAERDRLALLMPHLSRAIGVMMHLRDLELKAASGMQALDHLAMGVALFNVQGQVEFCNCAARKMMEAQDGLQLRRYAGSNALGELVAEDERANRALARAIRGIVLPEHAHAEHFSRTLAVPRSSGLQDYLISVSSLSAPNAFCPSAKTIRAIAFIIDHTESLILDRELLKDVYNLTPAEIRLTELMTDCHTTEQAAEQLGLSGHTIRSQLKSIYAKTHTHNRAQLIRLIMSLSQNTR